MKHFKGKTFINQAEAQRYIKENPFPSGIDIDNSGYLFSAFDNKIIRETSGGISFTIETHEDFKKMLKVFKSL